MFKSQGNRFVNEIFQVGAHTYVGQLLTNDKTYGGDVAPCAAAGAGPDTTSILIGICNSVVTSPTYDSTYKGDKATYDTTNATLQANDPVGPTLVRVDVLFPEDIVCFPLVKATMGTAPERKACTTGSSGLTFIVATIDTTVSGYSTAYCSAGANRGTRRTITTGATATQTVIIPFTYTIATGDTFVIVNLCMGYCHFDLDTQIQGITTSAALSSYYLGLCHQMELQVAGEEKAYVTISSKHLSMY